MRRSLFALLILLFSLSCLSFAAELNDTEKHPSCALCGMHRAKFSHSRMLVEYDDGTAVGTCSLHCAAVELANKIDRTPTFIGVGDYNSKKMIDAEKAFWVLGGSKPGVMTSNAKWAFGDKAAAEQFIKSSGGKLATFDEAIGAAYDEMWQDTKEIRERRKINKMHMNEGASK